MQCQWVRVTSGQAYGSFVNGGLIPYDAEVVLGRSSTSESSVVELFATDSGLCQPCTDETRPGVLLQGRDNIAGVDMDLYIRTRTSPLIL